MFHIFTEIICKKYKQQFTNRNYQERQSNGSFYNTRAVDSMSLTCEGDTVRTQCLMVLITEGRIMPFVEVRRTMAKLTSHMIQQEKPFKRQEQPVCQDTYRKIRK